MRWAGVVVAAIAVTIPGAACGGSARSTLHMRLVASGLDSPVYVTAPRGERGKLYVVEQPGVIRVLVNGRLQPQPFLDIHDMVKSGGEQGLLSLAFHPNYAKNHRFFVYFNDTSGDVRVYEFRSNGTIGLPGTGKSLLLVPHREFDNHNGGQLQFGPDGLLYAGPGHRGSGGYVYRGKAVPAARGRYFYGDYCSGKIWSLRAVHGKLRGVRAEPFKVGSLSSFGEDAAGELYATSLDGNVYRLTR